MQMETIDISGLYTYLFRRSQITALLDDNELWGKIPLEQRFQLVESSEFLTLMGEPYVKHVRQMLETEAEARYATIN
jgi:hypothetical protein